MNQSNRFRPADMILRELEPKLPGSKYSTSNGFPILFYREFRITWRRRDPAPGRFVVYTGHRDQGNDTQKPFTTDTALLRHLATVTSSELPAPPHCPYCGANSKLADRSFVYGPAQPGKMYLCSGYPACDASVGADPDTLEPFGTLANAELRKLRGEAHDAFDPLWKGHRDKRRTHAYAAAALVLGIDNFHIGNATPAQCESLLANMDTIRRMVEGSVARSKAALLRPAVRVGQSLHLF